MEYNPPPSVSNAEMEERWAKKFEEPGDLADVGRQYTRTVKLNEEMTPNRAPRRFRTAEELGQPEHAGRSAGDVAARAAASLKRGGTPTSSSLFGPAPGPGRAGRDPRRATASRPRPTRPALPPPGPLVTVS